MRWPLMFRSTHDALLADKDALIRFWSEQWTASQHAHRETQDRHDAYVARMAEHTLPAPKLVSPPQPVRPRDEADEAIERATLFNRDPRLRRHLEQFVRARRAEGVASGEIAQAILHPPASDAGEYEPPA